jgi:hypothetical protein
MADTAQLLIMYSYADAKTNQLCYLCAFASQMLDGECQASIETSGNGLL